MSNLASTKTAKFNRKPTPFVLENTGVIEDLMEALLDHSGAVFPDFPTDNASSVLTGARALVRLLIGDGLADDGKYAFSLSHKEIVDALFLLEGKLNEMNLLFDAYLDGRIAIRHGKAGGEL